MYTNIASDFANRRRQTSSTETGLGFAKRVILVPSEILHTYGDGLVHSYISTTIENRHTSLLETQAPLPRFYSLDTTPSNVLALVFKRSMPH